MNKVKILENTLRDGLYILDFLIDSENIYKFANKFLESGFDHIEVGHGLGIGAYKKFTSGFTDPELYEKLSPLLLNNKFFSFFIPSISSLNDLKIPKEFGLYGVRIGVEANDIVKYYPIIDKIKTMGFFVALNIMKSYTVTPLELIQSIKGLEDTVDVLYVVDSAGYMLPSDIKKYFGEINEKATFNALGFHGHNNLGLAMANALTSIEMGVEYIDTTLGGIGRSGGNVATESILAIMNKQEKTMDKRFFLDTLVLSEKFKEYLLSKGRVFSLKEDDILYGCVGFHSAYEDKVKMFSEQHGLDFRELLIKITEIDKVNINDKLLNQFLKG